MQATELLKYYLEAGVDETIQDHPVNRFVSPVVEKRSASAAAIKTRATKATPTVSVSQIEAIKLATSAAAACSNLDDLKIALENFEGCNLKNRANNTVFASGNADARLMIIDRPPSAEEDLSGLPFSGPQGDLLDKMLAAISLQRKDVYLAGGLPWRPPGGRAPTPEEAALCLPFIERHIALAAPEVLIFAGESAAMLLKQKAGINSLRGRWQEFDTAGKIIKVMPVFHPSFLLQHPVAKKLAWLDLQQIKACLDGM